MQNECMIDIANWMRWNVALVELSRPKDVLNQISCRYNIEKRAHQFVFMKTRKDMLFN